jgi:putative ABC transport system permease protein
MRSAQVASSLVYGVSPTDPLKFAAGATLLALVVLVATLVPCRRAAKLDPLEALRSQ